jgi:hypothetical protein
MIPIGNLIHVIRPNHTGKTNHKAHPEEKSDYDALAQREVEAHNDRNWDQNSPKIVNDIKRSLDNKVDSLIDTMLWQKRKSPVC